MLHFRVEQSDNSVHKQLYHYPTTNAGLVGVSLDELRWTQRDGEQGMNRSYVTDAEQTFNYAL